MDNQDQKHDAVSRLILILRKTTRIVKLLPFIYLVVFLLYLLVDVLCGEWLACFIEAIAIVSPSVTVVLLAVSRVFSLCRWHRTACIIPMLSRAEGVIDNYLFTFTQTEIIAIDVVVFLLCSLFLINAYKHFFYGRKAIS